MCVCNITSKLCAPYGQRGTGNVREDRESELETQTLNHVGFGLFISQSAIPLF